MLDAMETRRNAMVELINQNGTVSFARIREAFPDVSEMTLRTDLKLLDERKRIVRVHGGAKSVETVIGTDDYLSKRAVRNIPAKQKIAEKALSLLRPDTTIFLDSGSTATTMAHGFPNQSNLVYTTGLSCAAEFVGLSKPTVMLPGGRLNRYSQSVYGITAIRELERVNFSQTFLGVTSYSQATGFTCGADEEALLKQAAIRQAEQTIVLMDSSKVGMRSTFRICGLEEIDIVVSDGALPASFLEECEKHRVTVL